MKNHVIGTEVFEVPVDEAIDYQPDDWVPLNRHACKAAVTIDLHEEDDPDDIIRCDEWLRNAGIPATFFVPTSLLSDPRFKHNIAALRDWKYEFGTHGHMHDQNEINAFKYGKIRDLAFLTRSTACFEAFFGISPHAFRSPAWSGLNHTAMNELNRLGYLVDSSATPQRLGLFSSYPRENPWLFSKRAPHLIWGNLLEIPTNTFIFPLASPTFHTFRLMGSLLFLNLFMVETWLNPRKIITMQFHPGDFVSAGTAITKNRFKLGDLIPRTPGGIKAKYWLRTTDREKISRITRLLLLNLKSMRFNTLTSYYHEIMTRTM